MTVTAWGIIVALKRIYLAVWHNAASMDTHALLHDRGTIVRQIWGRP